MCGIAGLFQYRNDVPSQVDRQVGLQMVEAIVHRGPDDGGLLVTDHAMLGHRRLSILDLTDCGHQPMSDAQEQTWIIYNGEIYNYRQLRAELQADGFDFRSRTDTEVLLHGFRRWGIGVLSRLNGMFAFAILDCTKNELWLARDPIGVKPLYYYDDGRCLRFGSEIKAILADRRVPRRIDWEAVNAYLALGYVPAPKTSFAGIRSLMPGQWLRASARGVETQTYFDLPYESHRPEMRLEEAVESLGAAIDGAVARQLASDVPLGALLSGGLDSSAVVGAMSRTAHTKPKTFTIGFDDAGFDESRYADTVAKRYGTQHHAELVSDQAGSLLEVAASHADDPFADNSALAFYQLSARVRDHVTVALSGDGADELLAGYDTYRASQLAPLYRMIPRWLRSRLLQPLADRVPVSGAKYSRGMLLRRFVDGASHDPPYDHCSWRRMLAERERRQLCRGPLAALLDQNPLQDYARACGGGPDWLSAPERHLQCDLRFHLPNDMLVKVDRMSMAHSLEVRVPLLDLDVVRTCLAIPYRYKRQGAKGKIVLKELLRDELPSEIVDRRKAGFLLPIEQWLAGPWQPLLQHNLDDEFAEATGAFDGPTLQRMIREQAAGAHQHSYALFTLLMLAIWWRIWIAEQQPSRQRRPSAAAPTRVRDQSMARDGA